MNGILRNEAYSNDAAERSLLSSLLMMESAYDEIQGMVPSPQ